MKKALSFLIYALILGGSVFTLFYMFRVQIDQKEEMKTASQLNEAFKTISKIAIQKIESDDLLPLFTVFHQNGKNPGLAIGITYGVNSFPFYFGIADEKGRKIDENTLFEIGAVTQTFTGLWLARMIDQKQIPPDPLLHQILGSSTPLNLKSIRLIDLATHTAGFPKMPLNFPTEEKGENPFEHYSSDSLWNSLSAIQPDKIGLYQYSNYGFAALGESLSRFRGRPYSTLLRSEILNPLGLQSMLFGSEGSPAPPYLIAQPHRNGKPTFRLPLYAFNAAGGLSSTLPDLLKYMNAMTYPDRTPFPNATHLTLKSSSKQKEGLELGLGWYKSQHRFGTIIWKNGGAGGFRSFVGFWEDLPLSVTLLSNSDDEMIDLIGMRLLESLRKL